MTRACCNGQEQAEEDCWAMHGMSAHHVRRIAIVASEPTVTLTDTVSCTFTALSTTPAQSGPWYLDTGVSNRRCREHHLVDFVQPCVRPHVAIGHGSRAPIVGSGFVTISVPPAARGQPDWFITLTDVCIVPDLATNVVSAARFAESGLNGSYSTSLRVYSVEDVLGIKAWGATAESALPASLLPELACIDWHDYSGPAPALLPAHYALLPPPPSSLSHQAAAPAQAAHQLQPDLALALPTVAPIDSVS
jgi:hypothetical protein